MHWQRQQRRTCYMSIPEIVKNNYCWLGFWEKCYNIHYIQEVLMKKIFGIILAFFVFTLGSVGFAAQENLQKFYIITANDFHGHLRA